MRQQIPQVAVVPYVIRNGVLQIALITSLKRGRWIIPKGIVEPELGLAGSAEMEAFEEAGLRGSVELELLGSYSYRKWGAICRVEVYPLLVREVLENWPEAEMRRRRWASVREAIRLVGRPEVSGPIRRVEMLRGGSADGR